jgi:hypothetical protein
MDMGQIRNIATMVVTMRPVMTGITLRLASSNGSTLQIAAAGINAHGMIVPPPTKDKSLFNGNNNDFSGPTTPPPEILFARINDNLRK